MPTIKVANAAQLNAAFASARSGTTILLAAGDYGDVVLRNGLNTGTVTIRSASASAPAHFDGLRVNNIHNVVFQDIIIDHPLTAAEVLWTPAVSIQSSKDVYLVGLNIHGSLNGTSFDDGNGVTVTGSNNIAILNSRFSELNVALSINNSDHIIVAGNEATLSRSFMVGVAIDKGLFELNYLHDMMPNYAAGDHPDFFQIATGSVSDPSSYLTFRSNVFVEKPGDYIGGVYVQSERFLEGVKHSHITVENNFFLGNYRHALSFTGVENLKVSGNTVLNTAGTAPTAAIYLKAVDHAVIDRNIEPSLIQNITYPNTDVKISRNVDLWDPQFKTGVAQDLVVTGVGAGKFSIAALGVKAGSIAATLGAGFHPVAGIGHLTVSETAAIDYYRSQITAFAKTGGQTAGADANAGGLDFSGLGGGDDPLASHADTALLKAIGLDIDAAAPLGLAAAPGAAAIDHAAFADFAGHAGFVAPDMGAVSQILANIA